jgi:hypothetical protein
LGITGDNGSSEAKEITMSFAPIGLLKVVLDDIQSEGILDNRMEEAGYDLTIQETFDGRALFASGQVDMAATLSALEATQMGVERDMQLTANGKSFSQYTGMLVRSGSNLDPENTGGASETLDLASEEGSRLAIGTWGGGEIPGHKIVMDRQYGKTFDEDGGDYQNVVTAEYTAIPRLIESEDVDMGSSAPLLGAAPQLQGDSPTLTPVYWVPNMFEELGINPANLSLVNFITQTQFQQENSAAIEAIVGAWSEGVQRFHNTPTTEQAEDSGVQELLGAEDAQQAQYILDWSLGEYSMNHPVLRQDATLSEEWISTEKELYTQLAGGGVVPDGWDDHLSFNAISI